MIYISKYVYIIDSETIKLLKQLNCWNFVIMFWDGWRGLFVAQVHYTAGKDGYVILNQEELPKELPFSLCNQSPPDIQVNKRKDSWKISAFISVDLSTNQLLSKLPACSSLAAMSPGMFITQVITILKKINIVQGGQGCR